MPIYVNMLYLYHKQCQLWLSMWQGRGLQKKGTPVGYDYKIRWGDKWAFDCILVKACSVRARIAKRRVSQTIGGRQENFVKGAYRRFSSYHWFWTVSESASNYCFFYSPIRPRNHTPMPFERIHVVWGFSGDVFLRFYPAGVEISKQIYISFVERSTPTELYITTLCSI